MNGYNKPKTLTAHEIELIIDTHIKYPQMSIEGIGTHVGQIMSDEYNEAHRKEIEGGLLPPKHYRLTDTCVGSYIKAVEMIKKGKPYKGSNISKAAMNEYAKQHELPTPQYIDRVRKGSIEKQITVEELCPLETSKEQDPYDEKWNVGEISKCEQISASDKVEIAKYFIDQHLFFLKQLTGVI